MVYSELIKIALHEFNMPKTQFAEEIGISVATLYRILNDEAVLPSYYVLRKLEEHGVDTSELDYNEIYYEYVSNRYPDFRWLTDINDDRIIQLQCKKCKTKYSFSLGEISSIEGISCEFCGKSISTHKNTSSSSSENDNNTLKLIGNTLNTKIVVKFELKNNVVYGYTGNVEILTLPNVATKIHDKAFSNHKELRKICIGKNTKKIGKEAFKGCENLEEIVWSDSVTHIDDEAFMGCTSLKKISFPSSLKEIGNYAFKDCINLEKIIFPKNLNTIGMCAFESTAIDKIAIPSKVKLVCFGAFLYCKNLNTITVLYDTPQSKKRMEDKGLEWVYSKDYSFKIPKSKGGWSPEWNYKTNYTGYNSRYNYVFGKSYGDFIMADSYFPSVIWYNGEGGDIEIPENIDSISEYAFYLNDNVTSITFNARMTIYERAFSFCTALKKVVFKAGINSIYDNAFAHCQNLTQLVIIDDSYNSGKIKNHSFLNCSSLNDVIIADAVKSIEYNAFENCPCDIKLRYRCR